MDHKAFQAWLSGIDGLSLAQRQQAQAVLLGESEPSASLAVIEARVAEDGECPHCGTLGAVSRGTARGLRRYQCKACNKTFTATTGTALQGLHKKDSWLAFGGCLADGLSVRASARRCNFAVSSAFRWRHRFLGTKEQAPQKLKGIVEADETYVLESRKGDRKLDRKARRRGGKAKKRGLSDEQVAILVAVDRGGTTACSVLPAVTAESIHSVLAPRIDDDILLITDANNVYPPCAKSLGVRHEALNQCAGERVRGLAHIQTANNRHSGLKDFLRRYRGVASKYLENYLRWFERCELLKSSARSCLANAIGTSSIQFEN